MGANDLLIAAHALATRLTLVTDDRGFARIPELCARPGWQDETGDELNPP
jgi:predicted nucleic acid-binding protein